MYFLFDIGGTKMRFTTSIDNYHLHEPLILDTPQDFNQAIQTIKKHLPDLLKNQKIEKAAGGIAGMFDSQKSTLVKSPNLPDFEHQPIKQILEEILEVPVFLENDAAMVGLGEATIGAGKGFDIVAYITVSTGVGGARIVRGKIDTNKFGFEPGHQIINFTHSDHTGNFKINELESLVSGKSVQRIYNQDPKEITEPEIWNIVAKELAIGLTNTILHWSPDIVVLGGSMMKGLNIETVKNYVYELLIFPERPEFRKAVLRDSAGLYGALHYLTS